MKVSVVLPVLSSLGKSGKKAELRQQFIEWSLGFYGCCKDDAIQAADSSEFDLLKIADELLALGQVDEASVYLRYTVARGIARRVAGPVRA